VFTFCTTQRFWPCAVFFYFGPDWVASASFGVQLSWLSSLVLT
jgi:hypothetical protein